MNDNSMVNIALLHSAASHRRSDIVNRTPAREEKLVGAGAFAGSEGEQAIE